MSKLKARYKILQNTALSNVKVMRMKNMTTQDKSIDIFSQIFPTSSIKVDFHCRAIFTRVRT